jgi:N-acetylglucosaminyldiphosphoundecaprenol N-acetyl-beta-D-mannosaminyltransferase
VATRETPPPERLPSRADRVTLSGVGFDPLTEDQVVDLVCSAGRRGVGGWLVTPNVDILRSAAADPDLAALVARASVVVADGVPLLWATRVSGHPLPGRVAGASLIWSLSAAAAREGRSVYLLGGAPGVAERAGEILARTYAGLVVAGHDCPPLGFDSSPEGIDRVRRAVVAAAPDIVFCGLGFPKQERVIEQLLPDLPTAWFVGCGAAITFVSGEIRRAPHWMQVSGLEWVHRLLSEPRRLFRRYIVDDLPFAVRLMLSAARSRLGR